MLGEEADGVGKEGRFVLAAAHRHGGEKGRIGLHEQSVVGRVARSFTHVLGGAEGDDARDGDHEAAVEQLAFEGDRPCEAVDDAVVEVVFVEDAERGVIRVARMDHHGEIQFPRQFQLGGEKVALRFRRLRCIVEVEADFANGGERLSVVDDGGEVVSGQ